MIYSVCVIGTGNVARKFAPVIQKLALFSIRYVYSRKFSNASDLAEIIKATPIKKLDNVVSDVDVFMLWVSDDVLNSISSQIISINPEAFIIHSSGAKSNSELDGTRIGCMWPLQSISSSDSKLDVSKIPLCLQSDCKDTSTLLDLLANSLSQMVYKVTEDQKSYLHLTAVMTNNFINHLMFIKDKLLNSNFLSSEMLSSLIEATFRKAIEMDPSMAQTGPAIREDYDTIEKHKKLLQAYPEFLQVYEAMTNSILKTMK